MADRYIRRVDGLTCEMPGCGRAFSTRGTTQPKIAVCPECQEVAERAKAAEKAARKRAAARMRLVAASA